MKLIFGRLYLHAGQVVSDAQILEDTRQQLNQFSNSAGPQAIALVETAGGVSSPTPSNSLQACLPISYSFSLPQAMCLGGGRMHTGTKMSVVDEHDVQMPYLDTHLGTAITFAKLSGHIYLDNGVFTTYKMQHVLAGLNPLPSGKIHSWQLADFAARCLGHHETDKLYQISGSQKYTGINTTNEVGARSKVL